ncbi:hypothetical protein F66182_1491 [Fusarium sp. NRRL 66182]|nr:hypothetical protein F66182_1491 [Fusarium sp. NRRL 66182]
MYFRASFHTAAAIFLFHAVLANPIISPSSSSLPKFAPVQMTASDSFANSGTNYDTWAQRMVDEGKMWYPEKRSLSIPIIETKTDVVVDKDRGLSLRQEDRPVGHFFMADITCGGLKITRASYDFGREQYCQMMALGLDRAIRAGSLIASHVVCGNDDCTYVFHITASLVSWWQYKDSFDKFCQDGWLELWEYCKGLGGTAKLSFKASSEERCGLPVCGGPSGLGIEIGIMEGQAYPYDSGATCPANNEENVCKKINELA